MTDEIVVARGRLRTASERTVREAVWDHRDPDGRAEFLVDATESTTDERTTLDEFAAGGDA